MFLTDTWDRNINVLNKLTGDIKLEEITNILGDEFKIQNNLSRIKQWNSSKNWKWKRILVKDCTLTPPPPRKKKSNSVNKELERRDLISAEWKNKKQKTSISIDGKLVRKKLYDAFIEKSSVIWHHIRHNGIPKLGWLSTTLLCAQQYTQGGYLFRGSFNPKLYALRLYFLNYFFFLYPINVGTSHWV